jgi:hypothetical protein
VLKINLLSPKMKKYKIPENVKEIYISEKEPPYAFINELIQTQDKEWKIIPRLIYLEEITCPINLF